jgi:hypothetical protein
MNYLHTCMHALSVSATAGGTAATLGMGKGLPLQIVLDVLSNDRFGALVACFDVAFLMLILQVFGKRHRPW